MVTTAGITTSAGQTATPTPNNPPTVDSVPAPSFTNGTASEYDLDQHMSDPDGDALYAIIGGSLPSGVTLRANADDNALVYDGAGAVTTSTGHTLTADDLTDTSSASAAFDIPIVASATTADYVVRKDGTGDALTINAGIALASAGEIIEVQAATVGGSETYTENVLIDSSANDGTSGNEITLRARSGDSIRVFASVSSGVVFEIQDTSYWIIDGFAQLGEDTWTDTTPYHTADVYNHEYTLRIISNSSYIAMQNIGDRTKGNSNKIWGANNFSASQIGLGGHPDGVSHVKLSECHFELQGNNDNQGRVPPSVDWGDLLRCMAPQVILEDCTFHRGGHNTLSIEEGPIIMRRCITDQDWISLNTGLDGYRACEISFDKADNEADGTGDGLFENNIWRNALDGNTVHAICKNQSNRGVFRYNGYINGEQGYAIQSDRNSGPDGSAPRTRGSVTEGKWYHNTIYTSQSIFRNAEPLTTQVDMHFETSFVNFIIQDLGTGDPINGAYIYNQDEASDQGSYSDGWKGMEWRGITVDTSGISPFNIYLNDPSGATTLALADALTTWSANFFNWDEDAVTISSESNAQTSWTHATAFAGMTPNGTIPASVTQLEDLTTMVGAGSSATTGTFADGRFFTLADTDWDLSYFGETNDQVDIGGSVVTLVTLNKDTGVATWTPAISWSDGDGVNHAPSGVIPTNRGAVQ